jgi:hypothetical protein
MRMGREGREGRGGQQGGAPGDRADAFSQPSLVACGCGDATAGRTPRAVQLGVFFRAAGRGVQ